ncbi:MAG: M1 family aminopeptidase, partial [Planctomycetota bacterium]|nr:M1 family aminopeptidase [Planctomycetota bacterium]
MTGLRRLLPVVLPLAALVGCSTTARSTPFPESRPHEPSAADFDVEHYAIELVLDPVARAFEASCRIRFRSRVDGLRRIELDLVGLDVHGVTDGEGRALAFDHDGRRLGAILAEPLARGSTGELAVAYGGSPVLGLWFTGSDASGTPTQVFTQGQCDESRGWFPCFDQPSDRATSEIRVTMPSGWISVAAGTRIERVEEGGVVTEHWRMDFPHPSYLVTLVAGELHVQEAEWEGVSLWFVAEERYAPWLDATFHETDEILAFLSEYTGLRYPFSKYSQACVANFPWGGMENITATTLTPLVLDDELGNLDEEHHDLIAHEAA